VQRKKKVNRVKEAPVSAHKKRGHVQNASLTENKEGLDQGGKKGTVHEKKAEDSVNSASAKR